MLRLQTLTLAVLLAAGLCSAPSCDATIISLTNDGGTAGELGDDLDGIISGGPFATGVPGLNISVVAVTANGTGEVLNSNANSLGINDGPAGDDTDQFDAALNESVTFQFDQDVLVNNVDFVGFGMSEQFQFDGVVIDGNSPNLSSSVFTFTTPHAIAANTDFTLLATMGTIGIESLDVSLAAVPEPSTFGLLAIGVVGALGWQRRRRRKASKAV